METIITGVAFGQDQIQINYLKSENQGASGGIEEILTMDVKEARTKVLVSDIQEALVALVDEFFLSLRNPPDQIRSNRFLADDVEEPDE